MAGFYHAGSSKVRISGLSVKRFTETSSALVNVLASFFWVLTPFGTTILDVASLLTFVCSKYCLMQKHPEEKTESRIAE